MTNAAWSEFWSSEQNMCIQGEGSQIVNKKITQIWTECLTKILNEHAIFFDLASGSGYLSKLIKTAFSDIETSVVAYDYAKVNYKLYPDNVDIIDQQPIESISTLNGMKADIVASNFGFEYADIDKAFASMKEYTHKGSYLLLNCHHPQSIYSKDGKDIISAYKELNNSGLFKSFSELLALKDPIEKKQQAMNFFKEASIIDKRNGDGLSKMQIVEMLLHFYQINNNVSENLNHFSNAIEQQNNYIIRLEHQLQAAENYSLIINYLKNNSTQFDLIKEQDITLNEYLISKYIVAKIR